MSHIMKGLSLFFIWILFVFLSVAAQHYSDTVQRRDEELKNSPFALGSEMNNMEFEEDSNDMKMVVKRALSILTRWKSLGKVGRRTSAVNKSPRSPMSLMKGDSDFSARDLERRVGPVMRWGRRR